MGIEKLIETLKNLEACAYGYHVNGEVLGMDCSDFEQLMVDVAEEIAKIPALQAENEKLRAELEQVTAERDALIKRTTGDCWSCIRRYECNNRKGPHRRCWEFDPWLLKED